VLFSIAARAQRPLAFLERDAVLFEYSLDAREADTRRWNDFEIDLSRFAGQNVTLIFSTSVPAGGSTANCWAAWSDPIIESEITAAAKPATRAAPDAAQKHILLITSDALRADHLSCYGHPLVKTPHLDRLAREGCLFEHARAQTSTTLGSFASILTSRHATVHGLRAEWGHIPETLPTLPQHLHEHGYHTVIASSEAEVGADPQGMVRLFAQNVPCLAVPSQDGSVTTRQFMRWLDEHLETRAHQPFFTWLQYFDTHPPSTPPEPFRSLYYEGDPADPARANQPEAIALIHGTESVLEIEVNLSALEKGKIDEALIARLAATAEVLSGRMDSEGGPDLAAHLLGLGENSPSWRSLSRAELGRWLEAQVALLRQGEVAPELLEWLHAILPELRRIEAEVLSWLQGVKDYRYALAQYASGVAYLDFQIGQVLAALEERGLYDQTIIFFTSPHGEMLGENSMHFHHHALMEEVLRIPAIFKPAAGTEYSGGRISGVFDQIDVAPTLLESAGVPPFPHAEGASRWPQVITGAAIPEHDSISVDYQTKMIILARAPYIFYNALAMHCMFEQWQWQAGDCSLLKEQTPMEYAPDLSAAQPEVAREMKARLEAWRKNSDSSSAALS
jgi:arylsulfatase A-like enzyme